MSETSAGPREDPLEEVVAQEGVLGNPPFERGLEGVHVVDPLPAVGAFPEEILVHVGDGERVGVDPASAREDALEERALATGRQRRRDPRLEHRVTLDHAAAAGIEPRTVERVGHLPDQPSAQLRAAVGYRRRA